MVARFVIEYAFALRSGRQARIPSSIFGFSRVIRNSPSEPALNNHEFPVRPSLVVLEMP